MTEVYDYDKDKVKDDLRDYTIDLIMKLEYMVEANKIMQKKLQQQQSQDSDHDEEDYLDRRVEEAETLIEEILNKEIIPVPINKLKQFSQQNL